ncbi:hypothetical protein [Segniliparus rugosus]|uniref:hypothetical protein n=1 Tax=Segniliparus rugosus TaxID=286804 RepID=UPI0012EBBC6D|nr:hypothetical protein [Segniliparus rugosus]
MSIEDKIYAHKLELERAGLQASRAIEDRARRQLRHWKPVRLADPSCPELGSVAVDDAGRLVSVIFGPQAASGVHASVLASAVAFAVNKASLEAKEAYVNWVSEQGGVSW